MRKKTLRTAVQLSPSDLDYLMTLNPNKSRAISLMITAAKTRETMGSSLEANLAALEKLVKDQTTHRKDLKRAHADTVALLRLLTHRQLRID
jgi:hypothetical protein